MKYWVQFLTKSTKGELIDAFGSDAVMVLDGRLSSYNMNVAAKLEAQRQAHYQQHHGFRIVSGPRLFEEKRTSVVFKLTYPIQIN